MGEGDAAPYCLFVAYFSLPFSFFLFDFLASFVFRGRGSTRIAAAVGVVFDPCVLMSLCAGEESERPGGWPSDAL